MAETNPLPSGTATFLFTDIEGSTRLVQELGDRFDPVLDAHHRIMRETTAAHEGHVVSTEGDAFFVVFRSAIRAVQAAIAAQEALRTNDWPPDVAVKVRMGMHTGEATLGGDNYVGIDVHRAARISAVGYGGQVLISETTHALVRDTLPMGIHLRDLGQHRLKDLLRPEHLYQLELPGAQQDFPPLRTLDALPNNLPLQLTSFIGREREVAEGRRLLEDTRLLTLTGPGGTGKTRLSLQIAAEISDQFADGTFFVPLAPVSDPDMVPAAVAQSLGLHDSSGKAPMDLVLDHLHEKQTLLVLDNFEQVVSAAPLVAEMLRSCPKVKSLVSSRAALRVYGEQEFPVPPLSLPDPRNLPSIESLSQFEAVRLFIERAMASKPDFSVTNENAPAVAAICAGLDGLPLAIELAAARIKVLPPQAMLARLERTLPLLASGSRDLPERQQTLRGAISWSYDLLDQPTRILMARFGVFHGAPFDLVERVCGPGESLGVDVLDGLEHLVDQSLVRQSDVEGEPRFWMLATIREFSLERLAEMGQADATSQRHAEAFLELAEQAAPELTGADQKRWLDRLEAEHDNLRTALSWLVSHADHDAAARLVFACWRFWHMRGFIHEGRERCGAVIALLPPDDHLARTRAYEAGGGLAYWAGDFLAAGALYGSALEAARLLGDPARLANALYNMSFSYSSWSATDPVMRRQALDLQTEALGIYEDLGDAAGIATTHWGLGILEYFGGDFAAAAAHFTSCETHFRSGNDRFMLAWTLHMIGLNSMEMADLPGAAAALEEAIRLFADAQDQSGVVLSLDDFAQLALETGDRMRAIRLSGAATALERRSGAKLASVSNRRIGTGRPSDNLSGEEEARAFAEGQRMSLEDAVAYALGTTPS
ncbi:MAG: adenylate/guanylate cyclase domain-containing protein [Chloroflexi bacterium]|nr:adenylate/guanylate cyclase domain-containing protein [Chloroflexota bacterium]